MSDFSDTIHRLLLDVEEHPSRYGFLPNEADSHELMRTHFSVTHFEYREGISSTTGRLTTMPKVFTLCKDFHLYIQRLMKHAPLVQETYRCLINELHLSQAQAQEKLARLLSALLYPVDERPPSTTEEIAEGVSAHLLGEPYRVHVKIWLDNVWLDDERIAILTGVVIRRPVASDLAVDDPISKSLTCSAIIETFLLKTSPSTETEFVKRLHHALQLFDLGAVGVVKKWFIPLSPLAHANGNAGGRLVHPYKYKIEASGSRSCSAFLQLAMPQMPGLSWKSAPDISATHKSIYLAIERYQQALQNNNQEEQVATTMAAFEALLIEGDDNTELAYKLAMRVSYLSKYFGASPKIIFGTIKKAYHIRSRYVHGTLAKPKEIEWLKENMMTCLDTLRKTIVMLLSLSAEYPKQQYIELIDFALIDLGSDELLLRKINSAELLHAACGFTA